MKIKMSRFTAFALAFFIAVVTVKAVISSPYYTLYKIYLAINAKDYKELTKYVDVENVVSGLIDKSMNIVTRGEYSQLDKLPEPARKMTNAFYEEDMKPYFTALYTSGIKNYVSAGVIKGSYFNASFFSSLSLIDLKKSNNEYLLIYKKDKSISLKMKRYGNGWKIYAVDFPLPDPAKITPTDEPLLNNK